MSSHSVGRWLFGKLPSHGDFVVRGLDLAARHRVDNWLSQQMARARADYEAFEEGWYNAPSWLFVHNNKDDGAWEGGAVCASQDKVGRAFPVVMAVTANDLRTAAGLAAACVAAIGEAFEQGHDADWLHTAPLSPIDYDWNPERSEWALAGEEKPILVQAGCAPDGLIGAMLEGAA